MIFEPKLFIANNGVGSIGFGDVSVKRGIFWYVEMVEREFAD